MEVVTNRFAWASGSCNYDLVLPDGYQGDGSQLWPLCLFLHGNKRRGDDIELIREYGLNGAAQREGSRLPLLVLTPQCPLDSSWVEISDAIVQLLEDIAEQYDVDRSRIYITGFSMGGQGTWHIAAEHPHLFAAASPIAGYYHPEQAERLKQMPIWMFHGDADSVVPFERSVEMMEVLQPINPEARFTSFAGMDHMILEHVYEDSSWYEWLLSHRKG